MTRRSLLALATAALAALALMAIAWSRPRPLAIRAPEERPTLMLLTSLPLVFGESFSLSSGGSAALTRLEQRYNVMPIGLADAASLSGQTLLLMAHPRAQTAAALVDLDRWVRGGGRVLLLADPRLEWDSERPLGDRLRPPPGFADTGLLARWGMVLDAPEALGPVPASNGELEIAAISPGRLRSRSCTLAGGGFVARCAIGKGAATVIADADFLDVAPQAISSANLELMMQELDRLEPR